MANLPFNHECAVCEQRYYWCDSCARSKKIAPWKADVCSEECNAVLIGYKQYEAGKIGEEELKEILLANGFKGKKVLEPLQPLFDRLTADEPEEEEAPVLEPDTIELPLVEETGRWEPEDLGIHENVESVQGGHFSKRNRKNKSSK